MSDFICDDEVLPATVFERSYAPYILLPTTSIIIYYSHDHGEDYTLCLIGAGCTFLSQIAFGTLIFLVRLKFTKI